MLVPLTNAEIKALWQRAKSFAISKNCQDLAEDFAQEAVMKILQGRQTGFRNLLIDFLNKVYGDRPRGDAPRRYRRFLTVSLDDGGENGLPPLSERLPSPDMVEVEAPRKSPIFAGGTAAIFELWKDGDFRLADIGAYFGVSESRISQLIHKNIAPEIEKYFVLETVADLYRDDAEYSKLDVHWITL